MFLIYTIVDDVVICIECQSAETWEELLLNNLVIQECKFVSYFKYSHIEVNPEHINLLNCSNIDNLNSYCCGAPREKTGIPDNLLLGSSNQIADIKDMLLNRCACSCSLYCGVFSGSENFPTNMADFEIMLKQGNLEKMFSKFVSNGRITVVKKN